MPDWYGLYSASTWLKGMTPPSKGLRGQLGERLLNDLRLYRPDNTTENHPPMPVILQPGKHITEHRHPEWTLVYFIDAEDVCLTVQDAFIYPANNTAMLLSPNELHGVAKNKTDRPRLSLALRFKPDEH